MVLHPFHSLVSTERVVGVGRSKQIPSIFFFILLNPGWIIFFIVPPSFPEDQGNGMKNAKQNQKKSSNVKNSFHIIKTTERTAKQRDSLLQSNMKRSVAACCFVVLAVNQRQKKKCLQHNNVFLFFPFGAVI